MSRSYTLEQLKVVYKAGQANIPLEDVIKLLEWAEGKRVSPTRPAVSDGKTTRTKRKGKLGDQIIKYLTTQGGKKGAHVKDIAAALNAKVPNVTMWFYSTGKKFIKAGSIKKTAPATFTFVGKDQSLK